MPAALIIVGILAEVFAAFSIFEQWPAFGVLGFGSVAFAIAGGGLIAAGSRRLGAWFVIAGSVLFVPLGLVAIFGARKVLDADADAAFEARRRQA
jgi:hypothetical protein